MQIMRRTPPFLALFLLFAALANDNWPHWRGPNRTGMVDRQAPLEWGPETNVAWKLPLPELSGATPILWGGHIFLNVAQGDDIQLWNVNRNDGSVRWKRFLSGGNNVRVRKGNMSSPSPVTDGEKVWVMTGTGVLTAFDFHGNQLWQRNIQEDYGKIGVLHGYSSSPLLHGDSLYVQVLHGFHTDDPSYVLRIDKASGETKWRVERPTDALMESPDAYTTPALLQAGGEEAIVVLGGDYLTGHHPEDGRELWRKSGLNPDKERMYRIVASPVVHENWIYSPSRVSPLIAFRAESASSVSRVWSTDKGPDVPTPATDGKYLYILRDNGVLRCLDAQTGEVLYDNQRAATGTYSASPVLAGNRLYVTNEAGVTTVVQAGPEFKVLAENDLGEYTLSSPAVADGRIFLRTKEHLYCIGE